jgi:diacylglycerol kinase family enzyme
MGTEPHRVPLGRADGRFFTTNLGIGFDGAVVRRVQRRQRLKKQVGEWYFVWTAVRLFSWGYDRRVPRVRVAWGHELEQERTAQYLAIVQNTTPYTFLGGHGLRLCPDATLEGGLDCFSVDTMRLRSILPIVASAFGSGGHARSSHVAYLKDQRRILIRSDEPLPVQMDGEFLGERTQVLVESVPEALSVLY